MTCAALWSVLDTLLLTPSPELLIELGPWRLVEPILVPCSMLWLPSCPPLALSIAPKELGPGLVASVLRILDMATTGLHRPEGVEAQHDGG